MKELTIIILLIAAIYAEKARYDFYRVYEVKIEKKIHLELMQQISEYPDGYQFFTTLQPKIGSKTSIIVPPHKFGEWSELVEKYSINAKLTTKNFQTVLDRADQNQMRRKSLDWNRFWSLNETYGWIQDNINSRPADLSWFHIGPSYEGRGIKGLKVNVGNVPGKRAIFFEATIHAGEWLGATSTTYIINELLNDPSMASLLAQFEWYFLPIFNVDGYTYAWNYNRLWRKTRRPSINSFLCVGADPNRNSNVNWNVSSVSSNPCSERYPGDFPFSEPEMLQFSEFIKTIPNLDIYLSFHTFGQFTMIPYGFKDTRMSSYQLHYDIGQIANEAIFNKTGAVYELGQITDFFGPTSGISFDWVLENLETPPKITFCWELRPTWGDNNNPWDGIEGMEAEIISPALILPTAQDMYAATITVINEAIRRGIV